MPDPDQYQKRGTVLKIKVAGDAKKLVVRLLPKGGSPDSPTGAIRKPFDVPADSVLIVKLEEAYKDIVQISVHGGPSPWGIYSLGAGNGGVAITQVSGSDQPR